MQPVIGGAPGPIQKVEDAMNCAKIEGSLRARSELRRDTVSILQLLPHSADATKDIIRDPTQSLRLRSCKLAIVHNFIPYVAIS